MQLAAGVGQIVTLYLYSCFVVKKRKLRVFSSRYIDIVFSINCHRDTL